MESVLLAWLGTADLKASEANDPKNLGPIAQAARWRAFDRIVILTNQGQIAKSYSKWLSEQSDAQVELQNFSLTSPTNHGEIYEAVCLVLTEIEESSLTFHLSPGTPAMASVWVLLGKTRFPATLIESSMEHGVKEAHVPFDISLDYLPSLFYKPDKDLKRLSQGLPPENPEFEAILHRSEVMKKLVVKARRVAPRNIPVLLLGESGTGKELFARAIHHSSPRKDRAFVPVNCGAIPEELVDTELFGHEKGAFTGAISARPGHIMAAHGGTLFLDEIGELPLKSQIRLLRVLQEGEVTRVGATSSKKVDFRLICATNRDLPTEVAEQRFREDLYHRIAVAVLNLPPLREREGDINLLLDAYMDRLNEEAKGQPGHEHKELSVAARNLLLKYPYPGNIRELMNILQRAIVWSPGATVTIDDINDSIIPTGKSVTSDVLNRPLGGSLNLEDLLADIARHYISRALQESGGNKTKAAELVGLPSYQTFTNWMKRYGVPDKMAQDVK